MIKIIIIIIHWIWKLGQQKDCFFSSLLPYQMLLYGFVFPFVAVVLCRMAMWQHGSSPAVGEGICAGFANMSIFEWNSIFILVVSFVIQYTHVYYMMCITNKLGVVARNIIPCHISRVAQNGHRRTRTKKNISQFNRLTSIWCVPSSLQPPPLSLHLCAVVHSSFTFILYYTISYALEKKKIGRITIRTKICRTTTTNAKKAYGKTCLMPPLVSIPQVDLAIDMFCRFTFFSRSCFGSVKSFRSKNGQQICSPNRKRNHQKKFHRKHRTIKLTEK